MVGPCVRIRPPEEDRGVSASPSEHEANLQEIAMACKKLQELERNCNSLKIEEVAKNMQEISKKIPGLRYTVGSGKKLLQQLQGVVAAATTKRNIIVNMVRLIPHA